jgi:hypothetical protein
MFLLGHRFLTSPKKPATRLMDLPVLDVLAVPVAAAAQAALSGKVSHFSAFL